MDLLRRRVLQSGAPERAELGSRVRSGTSTCDRTRKAGGLRAVEPADCRWLRIARLTRPAQGGKGGHRSRRVRGSWGLDGFDGAVHASAPAKRLFLMMA